VTRSLTALVMAVALFSGMGQPTLAATQPGRAQDLFVGAWIFYKGSFVAEDGRVVDNGNAGVSHSEGQGYGMLLAVAADDRQVFEKIWSWTQSALMVREDDSLSAWRWDPAGDPNVADPNNATDGDLLVAWALLRAYRKWSDPAYFAAAERIAADLANKAVVTYRGGTYMLPGVDGFWYDEDEAGPNVNPSYWVYPALDELRVFAPDFPADRLIQSGLKLHDRARFGDIGLPADWTVLTAKGPEPAEQYPATYGYNAIRVPLYLAWYGQSDASVYEPFENLWAAIPEPSVVDLVSGKAVASMHDNGYRVIESLVSCAQGRKPSGDPAEMLEMVRYYPSTLSMLSLLAMVERYPQCLDVN
jgi:endo-1,4-beta-D-glucanase Y